jgi:MFS transporter, DHA1 family, multidrug resistance protein
MPTRRLRIAPVAETGETLCMSTPPSTREFIVLIALMISLVAMTTDVMLPGLGTIATELGRSDPNDGHQVISILFAGFAVGQFIAGPLSDCYGRRRVIHISYVVFVIGTLMALFATSFGMLLAGRLLQGLGMAGPRIVSIAIVRDGHEGRAMARIMSFVMAVFIIVPAIAPAVGQAVMAVSGWRGTFALLLVMAALTWTWFTLRQPETLAIEDRRTLSPSNLWAGLVIIAKTRAAIGYTVCTGLIFGPFLAYLSLSQQIFQQSYDTGAAFALWFGVAALAIGAASIVNSALVERLGMRFLSNTALIVVALSAGVGVAAAVAWEGHPPFALFMAWLLITFFCMGLLFGNLNALAMEPLGRMAGLGAAVVGALSTAISIPIGVAISESFDGGIGPLVAGFGLSAVLALGIGHWAGGTSGQATPA